MLNRCHTGLLDILQNEHLKSAIAVHAVICMVSLCACADCFLAAAAAVALAAAAAVAAAAAAAAAATCQPCTHASSCHWQVNVGAHRDLAGSATYYDQVMLAGWY